MIRKLKEHDKEQIINLIKDEPEFNLYIIGDIENFGFEQDFMELFGEFNENEELKAVSVRFFNIFMLYCKESCDYEGFAKIMNEKDYEMIVGKTEIISNFENTMLKLQVPEVHSFSVLREINKDFKVDPNIKVKKATLEDVDSIVDLKNRIDEFSSGSNKFKEILENDIKAGTANGYYVEVDGIIVSYAQSSAENSMSAMVVSIMTHKEYRKSGLASACVKKLCEDKIREGKTLCLFYKNLKAGEIYKRIGFKEIGKWSMYKKEK